MTDSGLEPNSTDKRVQAYKAIAGLLPGGSVVSEYLIGQIPEQRIERVIQFVEQLRRRLERVEAVVDVNNPRFVELFEDAFEQASKSHSEHRVDYLTRMILPNDSSDESEWQVRRKLLQIFRELTDLDIEILIGHLDFESLIQVQRKYQSHPMITLRQRETFTDQEMFAAESQSSYFDLHVATLVKLRLLSPVIQKPDFSSAHHRDLSVASAWAESLDEDGNPLVDHYRVTQMGRLLIGAITGRYPRSQ